MFRKQTKTSLPEAKRWSDELWSELCTHPHGLHALVLIEELRTSGSAVFGSPLNSLSQIYKGRLACENTSSLRSVSVNMTFHTDEHLGSANLSRECVGWANAFDSNGFPEIYFTIRATKEIEYHFEKIFYNAKIFGIEFIPVWFTQDPNLEYPHNENESYFHRTIHLGRINFRNHMNLNILLPQIEP
jgi:hypothetical protein